MKGFCQTPYMLHIFVIASHLQNAKLLLALMPRKILNTEPFMC